MNQWIWLFPVLAVLSAIVWFGNGIRKIGAVSSGTHIGDRRSKAMLLIDLQSAFWEAGTYSEDEKAEAKDHILKAVQSAKHDGIPVIAIRHEWTIPSTKAVARLLGKGLAIAGTRGTELIAPFDDLADHVIVKRVQDGFETGELDTLLEHLDVGRLLIAGLDTNFCVAKTALAARQRGYEVEIEKRETLTANKSTAKRTLGLLREKGVAVS
ncbi:MAG: isochorismatase family cysteine hydrolase [Pseudomonadota bacterium]